ncbi:hypothetical protein DES41_108370 [Pseudorhodoferax soli]|uniref:Uncharacterized protein n=1 Tax=Pseudorhodoferax soli TaxID=545864 RepID=A0A368XMC3_9BURK|nr:hypothetical protein DES41_108370 [Pseudorhodoferax soli]
MRIRTEQLRRPIVRAAIEALQRGDSPAWTGQAQ